MISNILTTRATIKILKLFSIAPGKSLILKEIKEFTKIPNVSVANTLNKLVVSRILNKEDKKYRLDLSNPEVEKIIEILKTENRNLREIPYRIWLILFEISFELNKINLENSILFGSWSKHIAKQDSDIDIAIIIKKRNLKEEMLIEKSADKISKKYGQKIQLHFIEKEDFERNRTELIREIKRDGIRFL